MPTSISPTQTQDKELVFQAKGEPRKKWKTSVIEGDGKEAWLSLAAFGIRREVLWRNWFPRKFFKIICNWRIIPQRIFNNGYAFQITIIHIKNLYDKKIKILLFSKPVLPLRLLTQQIQTPLWIHVPIIQVTRLFHKEKQAVVRMLEQSWKGHNICNFKWFKEKEWMWKEQIINRKHC